MLQAQLRAPEWCRLVADLSVATQGSELALHELLLDAMEKMAKGGQCSSIFAANVRVEVWKGLSDAWRGVKGDNEYEQSLAKRLDSFAWDRGLRDQA